MADLVIRGMDMPSNGYDCPLNTFGFCNLAQDETHYECVGNSRPEWCPLVPLPEGHGDLIDRDKLAKRLKDFVDWCRDDRREGAFFVMDCPLPDSPTIVPAEGGTDDDGNA